MRSGTDDTGTPMTYSDYYGSPWQKLIALYPNLVIVKWFAEVVLVTTAVGMGLAALNVWLNKK